jgi:DNA polymerase-3 subunit alpha
VVLAKNDQGYRNLVKLTTISHLEGFQGKGIFGRPCINKQLLKEYHEGLIVTSACLGGEIPQEILRDRLDEARKVAQWYQEVFGDDFYLEIQDHGSPEDRVVNVEIVRIAQELGIKVIATNDSHYISCYDVEAHDALLCIQTGQLIREDKRMRYSGTEYLKSADEMRQLFLDHLDQDIIEQAIANTLEVAGKVGTYHILGEPKIPDFPIPPGHTPASYVTHLSREGLKERLKLSNYSDIGLDYQNRLDYELQMLDRMGFSTYFLVVWDYIKYARDNNIPVGPGRGSAAGSLVAYALKITNIDPVHHGLLFERFLNPERKSMPDIDTDFCIERRDDVIKYVTEKYGKERVAQIITFNRMTSKAVLKDVARVLNIPYADADKMAKMIPVVRGKPTKLSVMISDKTPAPEFKNTYETAVYHDPETGQEVTAKQWLDMAMRIEGTNKTFGVHAAGVVISAEPLDQIVPLQKNNDGSVITQYFMEDLESLGLLKMDFLGLKNLTIIQNTLDLIRERQDITIDPDEITAEERKSFKILSKGTGNKKPPQVTQTYKTIEKGDLEGVFQLESSGMLDVVERLKPSSIEDISSILALYRPGPLDAGLIPKFIDRKHGREAIIYDHPDLEPILNETYGVLVYQEQIMKIAQDLAGYSLGQADLLRRAMGKKKPEEMRKQKEIFLDGASKKGINEQVAEALFEQMEKFAEYCFNKSHSTAYGYVTYQTAYLKANYSVEYMAALLTANSGDQDKVTKYLNNCEQTLGIKVEPPDINRSSLHFKPLAKENTIIFGLSAIKNVGEGAIENILTARNEGGEFTSLADLCQRVNLHSVNNRNLEALIKCGAFDRLNPNRKQLLNDLNLIVPWAQGRAKDKASGQGSLFDLLGEVQTSEDEFQMAPQSTPVEDFSAQERLQFEQELLGVYVSDHPLKSAEQIARKMGIKFSHIGDILEGKVKGLTTIIAMFTEIKQVQTKKDNKPMGILKITDITGQQLPAVIFNSSYEKHLELLNLNIPLIITGKINKRDDETQLVVDEVQALNNNLILDQEPDYLFLIELSLETAKDPVILSQIKSTLHEYNTNDDEELKIPVYALIIGDHDRYLVRFGEEFYVQQNQGIIERLKTINLPSSLITTKK